MIVSDIKRVIEQVSRDKGIDTEILIRAIEEAMKSAARKRFGNKIDVEVKYNEELGEIEVFQFRDVVEEFTEPVEEYEMVQIPFKQAVELDPECEIGDSIGTKMDTASFGRIAAQSAKQVIIQKMKDAEREAVYTGFIDRKGETINGIVQRIERGSLIVNLGTAEGILPDREQVPKETYRRGDRIRAYIMDVRQDTRGPQVILSRTHPNFLISLFKTEVPEVSESIVTIMNAAREPGIRSKIAVSSNDSDIDPVGACVGMKGSRVQNVVQELRGEKIDIISWHVDPAKFVCNALAPAEISRVIIDEENRSMEVIVPDEFLSVAIGKRGQNVRLASKLTKWHLDVKSESQYNKDMQIGYESLMSLPGISMGLADALYEKGFFSAEEIGRASADDLMQVPGITEDQAREIIKAARNYLHGYGTEDRRPADEVSSEEKAIPEEVSSDSQAREEADAEEISDGDETAPEEDNETSEETASDSRDRADAEEISDGDETAPEEDNETSEETASDSRDREEADAEEISDGNETAPEEDNETSEETASDSRDREDGTSEEVLSDNAAEEVHTPEEISSHNPSRAEISRQEED